MEKSRKYVRPLLNNGLSKTQERKRKRRKYPNVFFKKEIVLLFDGIDNIRTMMGAFASFICALRISEVSKQEWINIDLQEARWKVVNGKNHKDGFIPISPLAIPILKKWRAMNPNEKYFLPSEKYKTGYYDASSLLKDYIHALERADLRIDTEKSTDGRQQHQYKFHTLRHSRCTHLLSNGVPVEKVQKFMRHDDLETTMTYTWIMDREMNKMVVDADVGTYDTATPRSNGTPMMQPSVSPMELWRYPHAGEDVRAVALAKVSIKELSIGKGRSAGIYDVLKVFNPEEREMMSKNFL